MARIVRSCMGVVPMVIPLAFIFHVWGSPLDIQSHAASSSSRTVQGQPVARIPFLMNSGLITIPVRINDSKELRMVLDTGMSSPIVVLFHRESIEEIGLSTTQNVLLGGAGGGQPKPAFLATGARVRIEDLDMAGQTVVIFDDGRATSEWRWDGIIGKTLFDNYLTRVDYEASVVELYVPLETRVDASLVPIPVKLDSGIPIVETTISLDGRTDIPVRLVVDLGNRNALYFPVDEKKGIQAPPRTIESMAGRGIQGGISSRVGRLTNLRLGPYSFKHIPTSFLAAGTNMGLGKDLMDGNLGQLILNRFEVILDYAHKQVFLVPNKHFGEAFEYDMAGLVLEQYRDGVYDVRYVVDRSPAAEKGVLKGDKIVALNGKDVRDYAYRDVMELLRHNGRKVRMTIERGNERFEKTITLRRLI